jgi:flagellin-like protein
MRRARYADEAVSEIVGALILILVVTVAGTAIAGFVMQQQKQAQAEKSFEQARALEHVEVASIRPTLATSGDRWTALNFTLMNAHGDTSTITGLTLNGERARSATVERYNRTTNAWETAAWSYTDELDLAPEERIFANLTATDFDTPPTILVTDAIQLDVSTARLNHFERDFLPPSALALVDVKSIPNGTGYNDTVILDGTQSDAPDASARIVRWDWNVNGGGFTMTLQGRLARGYVCDGTAHDITLRVTDNFGLFATDTILGYAC